MVSCSQVLRLIALALLFMAGLEVLACDLISPETCPLSNAGGHQQAPEHPSSGDNCLCCCLHWTAPQIVTSPTFEVVIVAFPPEAPSGPVRFLPSIYHPPRA